MLSNAPVSYTHLAVYKRQPLTMLALIIGGFILALTVAVQLIERAQRVVIH